MINRAKLSVVVAKTLVLSSLRRLIIFFLVVGRALAALPRPTAFIFGDRFMMAKLASFPRLFIDSWRHGIFIS